MSLSENQYSIVDTHFWRDAENVGSVIELFGQQVNNALNVH